MPLPDLPINVPFLLHGQTDIDESDAYKPIAGTHHGRKKQSDVKIQGNVPTAPMRYREE